MTEATEPAAEGLVLQRLRERFGDAVRNVRIWRHETAITLAVQDLVPVCRYLKDDSDLAFDFLSSVVGVDRRNLPDNAPRFEVVYHLYSVQFQDEAQNPVRRGVLRTHIEGHGALGGHAGSSSHHLGDASTG